MTTPITGLDLTGFQQREQAVWTDAQGLILSLHYFPLVPDLPAPLHALPHLRAALARSTAAAGAGLIEADAAEVHAVPALRQLLKIPHPQGHGQVFIGSYTIPKATCSAVIKLQAPERGPTGMRESMVAARVGHEHYFRPHPYAPDATGGLPYHVADLPEWDASFPGHPLTLVRAGLHRLAPTVSLHEQFRTLPPFGHFPPAG
ncbi:hypothetical protein OG455_01150 [Kitasatospora sp. NBC_01287]|uniref:hypothetical protein n=1 Tax=Kitasatospora sp. NBC_01287 TaxID=2903573 RepID=UPI00224F9C2D|nr:hypothetical protein [Kitasatospora sp. NBC_01287]MCX4744131.1 hypothetical protein [Kitasatospora sp. NBC_01287]